MARPHRPWRARTVTRLQSIGRSRRGGATRRDDPVNMTTEDAARRGLTDKSNQILKAVEELHTMEE